MVVVVRVVVIRAAGTTAAITVVATLAARAATTAAGTRASGAHASTRPVASVTATWDGRFLKAWVIMMGRHLPSAPLLLPVLDRSTAEMEALRALLTEQGRYPTRRTWERRLRAMPATLPAQIGCLGQHLVELLDPWR